MRADRVTEALAALAGSHPDLARGILDASGQPRPFVRLLVNEVDIGRLAGTATPLADGDRVAIVIPIGGG